MAEMHSPKVILYVSHTSYLGGAETSLLMLIQHLDRQQYRPVLIFPGKGPLAEKLLPGDETLQLSLLTLKRTFNPFILAKYIASMICVNIALYRIAKRKKASLIHVNSATAFLYSFLAGYFARIPVITHIRDKLKPGFISRIIERFSQKIICVSHSIAAELSLNRTSGAVIVHNGIDTDQWNITGSALQASPDPPLVVAQIGQLIPWKNHTCFILAAKEIVKEFPGVKFVILGSDTRKDFPAYKTFLLQLIEENHLGGYFHFIEHREEILPLFKNIDILFHPAVDEPFGRVIIEAMSLQKAVVAAGAYGPAEIIQDGITGFLAKPGDADDMASKTLRLLKDPQLRHQMGKAAREKVVASFNIRRHTRMIEGVYLSFSS